MNIKELKDGYYKVEVPMEGFKYTMRLMRKQAGLWYWWFHNEWIGPRKMFYSRNAKGIKSIDKNLLDFYKAIL